MWYNRAAAEGSAIGFLWLGCFYSHGAGLQIGQQEPIVLGDPNWRDHATLSDWGNAELNYSKAIRCYTSAAQKGDSVAQCQLGFLYSHGESLLCDSALEHEGIFSIEKNLAKASEWYIAAAEQGSPIAQYRLGYFYLRGLGVNQDLKKSFYWLLKAAKQGHKAAQNWIGYFYETGIGVEQDNNEAAIWHARSKSN